MSSANSPPADRSWYLLLLVWLVATSSTLGALFFSEVMHVVPCALCWYQRIFMFPLALMLPFALFPLDKSIVRYALPLAIGGLIFATFHLLLIYGVVPEAIRPCTQGVPCTDQTIEWLGFVTIPMLSVAAFSTIISLLLVIRNRGQK